VRVECGIGKIENGDYKPEQTGQQTNGNVRPSAENLLNKVCQVDLAGWLLLLRRSNLQ
jgi:hypothetical protein